MSQYWFKLSHGAEHVLTHWGRVTHICVSKFTIIGSDNGLSSSRRQAIIWTNAGILLIGPLGINASENLIKIYSFSFKKMDLKMSSGKWRPSCRGLNVLSQCPNCWWPSSLRHECITKPSLLSFWHYNNVTWTSWGLESPVSWLFVQQLMRTHITETSEFTWGEFSGDRWIPHAKGQ